MTRPQAHQKITKADLEARFAQLQGGATQTVANARDRLIAAAFAGGVIVIVLTYLLGWRKGRKKTTVVEIRRV